MKGNDLRNYLRGKGFTMSEIAEKLNLTPQALSNQFASDNVKTGLIESIAEITGLPVSSFYGEGITTTAAPGSAAITGNGNQIRVNDFDYLKEISAQRKLAQDCLDHYGFLLRLVDKLVAERNK